MLFYFFRSPVGKAEALLGKLEKLAAAFAAVQGTRSSGTRVHTDALIQILHGLRDLERRANAIKGFGKNELTHVESLPQNPDEKANEASLVAWNLRVAGIVPAFLHALKADLKAFLAKEKAPKGESANPAKKGGGFWGRLMGGCVVVLGLLALLAAGAAVGFALGLLDSTVDTSPPTPQLEAPTPAPTPPAPTSVPTPPAPAPMVPATSGQLDCTNAFSMTSDMDGDGDEEPHAIVIVHGGATTLDIEGGSVANGKCFLKEQVILDSDFASIRKELKKALGSSLPTEGMTNPVKVQGRTVICNIGSGPTSNCFE